MPSKIEELAVLIKSLTFDDLCEVAGVLVAVRADDGREEIDIEEVLSEAHALNTLADVLKEDDDQPERLN